jgi:predicted nuclease of predicted toxin-antitoxin system
VKLLLDENLSPRLVASLESLFPGSRHVHSCNLGSANDVEIWEYAKAHGFVIASKDSDFAERSILLRGSPKVIWIRVGNCSTAGIEELLRSANKSIRDFVETDEETCLVLSSK